MVRGTLSLMILLINSIILATYSSISETESEGAWSKDLRASLEVACIPDLLAFFQFRRMLITQAGCISKVVCVTQ